MSVREPDYSFEDQETGVALSYFLPESTPESEQDLPYVESIDVMDGEECLHAEGECDACDQLRDMYRDGEIAELHRVSLSPAAECDGSFHLSVPLVTDSDTCELYRCDGGTLESEQRMPTPDEQGVAKVVLSDDFAGIQSPFGIAYGGSDTKGSSAQRIKMRVAVPPDDDEPEDEELEEDADDEEALDEKEDATEEETSDEKPSVEEQSSMRQDSEEGSLRLLIGLVATAFVLCFLWVELKRS